MTTAPFFRRLAARLIDLAFALVLTFAFCIPIGLVFGLATAFSGGLDAHPTALGLGVWLCFFLAYIALEWFLLAQRGGQTLGKGLMGLRVVRKDASTPTPAAALIRLLVFFIPFYFAAQADGASEGLWVFLADMGLLWSLVSVVLVVIPKSGRRAVHDYLAGTRVVRAPKRAINLRKDIAMMVPQGVNLRKDA